jgi:thiosulfate dehydrogenase (quinone) large subunit
MRDGRDITVANRSDRNLVISDPPFAVDLFNSTRWAWLWLILRLYLGYTWLTSGIPKLTNPAWMETGQALRGFWMNAVQVPEPPARPPIAFDWYRAFLQWMLDIQAYTWFAQLIVIGEVLVGVALIVGAFVGIAAFFGAFLNWNFMMAGTASINPLMFVFTILVILAWKTAGWYGLDRWLLPLIGTPWRPGQVFSRRDQAAMPVTGDQVDHEHDAARRVDDAGQRIDDVEHLTDETTVHHPEDDSDRLR